MTLKQFIKVHRSEIDLCIKKYLPGMRINDSTRRDWLRNTHPSNNCWENLGCNKICRLCPVCAEDMKTINKIFMRIKGDN